MSTGVVEAYLEQLEAQRYAAARGPLHSYISEQTLPLEELIIALQRVVADNPAKVCWCGDLADWLQTVDIMVTQPVVRTVFGEAAVFVCDDHVSESSGSAYPLASDQPVAFEGWRD